MLQYGGRIRVRDSPPGGESGTQGWLFIYLVFHFKTSHIVYNHTMI